MNIKWISCVSLPLTITAFLMLASNVESADRCFKCTGAIDSCQSLQVDTCSSSQSRCLKAVTTTGNVQVVEKGCSDSCFDGRVLQFGPTTINYYCCQDELCNGSIGNLKMKLNTQILYLTTLILIGLGYKLLV